jgi:hypothetical protein
MFGKSVLTALCLSLLSACASTSFNIPVKKPVATELKYDVYERIPYLISITDSRPKKAPFSEGRLNFNIQFNGKEIDEAGFFTSSLIEELKSRGMLVSQSSPHQQNNNLDILTLKIVNHRQNGFSPLVTFTQFSGDFTSHGETKRIVSFIKRGKVPIWVVNEESIVENTYNQPISLLVQDIATRIIQGMGNWRIPNSTVESLAAEINRRSGEDPLMYMKVYQLGYGNNASAIPHLLELIDDADEYIRLAAISSLGLLGAKSEVERLTYIFKSANLWQDRGMALKALADLDTVESRQIVDAEWARISSMAELDKEAKWNKAILMLYR